MEVLDEYDNVRRDHDFVLNKWKVEFESLLNPLSETVEAVSETSGNIVDGDIVHDDQFDMRFSHPITIEEVKEAVCNVKRGKACGVDGIPGEVIKTDAVIDFLFKVLSVCYNTGRTPKQWGQGIINPIPKSSTSDPKDPMSYRGITLTSVVYKIDCSILKTRLTFWCESENMLVDEQNGFRKGRSTIDHISTLTNIVETRKKRKLSTYCAFIDFKKAYDTIDRNILWL